MKRWLTAVLMAAMLSTLVACGSSAQVAEPDETARPDRLEDSPAASPAQPAGEDAQAPDADAPAGEGEGDSSQAGTISADMDQELVELTLPASLVGGIPAELTDQDRARGFRSVVINGDGSATYTIGRGDYDRLLAEFLVEIDGYFDQAAGGGDYPSVKQITRNSDATEVTILVDRSAFETSLDSMIGLMVTMQCGIYQAFAGKAEDEIGVTIHYQDEATGEIFDTARQ